MEPIYTQEQVDNAWKDYRDKQVLRCRKDGKIVIKQLSRGIDLDGAQSAEVVNISKVMGFPKFLKGEHG